MNMQVRRKVLLLATVAAIVAAAVGVASALGASGATKPVKIGIVSTVIPGVYDSKTMYVTGGRAAFGWIREHGGWGGRGLQLDWCTTPGDPASDTKCWRQMADDNVDAVIGIAASAGTLGTQILAPKNIPMFMVSTSTADNNAPNMFALTAGTTAVGTAFARYACIKGAKKIAVIRDDTSFGVESLKYARPLAQACGMELVDIPQPYGVPDPAPYVQKAVNSKPDLILLGGTTSAVAIRNAALAAGWPLTKGVMGVGSSPDFFNDPKSVGLTIAGNPVLPTNPSPDAQTYLKMVAKYGEGGDPTAQLAVPAYQQVTTIWQAARTIGWKKVTGASLTKFMKSPAALKLKVLFGVPVTRTADAPAVLQPYNHYFRLGTAGKLTELGWYFGYSSCSSPATCKAKGGYLPPQAGTNK